MTTAHRPAARCREELGALDLPKPDTGGSKLWHGRRVWNGMHRFGTAGFAADGMQSHAPRRPFAGRSDVNVQGSGLPSQQLHPHQKSLRSSLSHQNMDSVTSLNDIAQRDAEVLCRTQTAPHARVRLALYVRCPCSCADSHSFAPLTGAPAPHKTAHAVAGQAAQGRHEAATARPRPGAVGDAGAEPGGVSSHAEAVLCGKALTCRDITHWCKRQPIAGPSSTGKRLCRQSGAAPHQ